MQKFIFTILTIAILLISGCDYNNQQVDKSDLEKLITEAIAGDQDAIIKLQGLLTSKHIGNSDYNQLLIDELQTNDKSYFSVILEYPDPRLNIFAIYDDNLNFYLLDKSLNGYLNSKWVEVGTRKFAFLQERFFTKDILSIDRLSIYEIHSNSASLVYRSLSRFAKDNILSYQTVESITKDYILTKINGPIENRINNQPDTFYFNINSKKYLSKTDVFENFVNQEINNFIWITTKPQVTEDYFEAETDTVVKDYKITLDREWQIIPKFIESTRIKQSLEGVKYVNKSNGSSFTVLQIPLGEDGEKYSPYILTETKNGQYRIRASAVFEIGNNYLQIFEHSCGNTKYLLLFECPISIYLENRKIFSDIINSFSIDC
ncbi:MAG: hypothetical protein OQK56_02545 [Ignavibacteriaceae bacterium]|nr:hypothetical protein [Ignavibacteriaceae bacterium]